MLTVKQKENTDMKLWPVHATALQHAAGILTPYQEASQCFIIMRADAML